MDQWRFSTFMKKKQTTDDFIEKLIEKKVSEKDVIKLQNNNNRSSKTGFHSASSSFDSSSAGGFSSSEAESLYGSRDQRPKPIRTSLSAKPERFEKPLQYKQKKLSNIYESHSHYHQQNKIGEKMNSKKFRFGEEGESQSFKQIDLNQ
ncbi:hypothetical protein FRX31_013620 [Thalictrum thalictroides]|uniref:Uncharacterized protein n=1 Tax=Thalictrum thalictroides TaxID=46969 RepID=A0A7J6WL11_THATH|nr:hypothetical protein FRX31_013620 [Thalictrum thalictroides]